MAAEAAVEMGTAVEGRFVEMRVWKYGGCLGSVGFLGDRGRRRVSRG
jgi:hypothetical protein